MTPKHVVATVTGLVILLVGSSVLAQALEYKLENRVPSGSNPAIILRPGEPLKMVIIEMQRDDGKKIKLVRKKLRIGSDVKVPFRQPKGRSTYKGTMTIVSRTGDKQTLNLDFDCVVATPVSVQLDSDLSSVAKKQVVFRANAVVTHAEMEIYDAGGNQVASEKVKLDDVKTGDPLVLKWTTNAEVKRVNVKLYDPAGYWTAYELAPFYVEIPHEEVVFETGKATFRDSEKRKLDKSLADINNELTKIRKAHSDIVVNLYVAGYTDTVGDKRSNLGLSERRARAIAAYWSRKGLRIPIYVQGFGEDGLAVKTDDNVDEERNRRALYLLGNVSPPLSHHIPRSNWRRVQ